MKNIFIIFLSLCCYFSFAQENTQRYEEAVDYVICVCINDTGEKQKDCDNGYYYQESDFQDKSNNNGNYLLFEEFQRLKGENIAEDKVVSFLSEDIFKSEKYKKIKAFAENPKRKERINDIKQYVREHLNSIYSDVKTESKLEEKKDIETPVSDAYETQKSEPQKVSFFAINFWTILFLLLIIGIIIFVYTLGKWISDIEGKVKRIEKNDNSSAIVQPDFQSTNNTRRLEEKIQKINNRLDRIESSSVSKKETPVSEQPKEVILQAPKKEPETTVFYMATPNAEKTFDIRSKSDVFLPTRSLYKFFVDNSEKKAAFEFHSDESGIRESANSPHLYIEPVCEPQNAQNPNAKKITTIEKGVAENQGDKWVVTKKAKIRYE